MEWHFPGENGGAEPHPGCRRRRLRIAAGSAIAVGVALAGIAILHADPERSGIGPLPPCSLKLFTGWDCPGCGATRAAHEMVRGRLENAFRFNPFVVGGGAIALLWAGTAGVRRIGRSGGRGHARRSIRPVTAALIAFGVVAATAAFGVIRNQPWYPYPLPPMGGGAPDWYESAGGDR